MSARDFHQTEWIDEDHHQQGRKFTKIALVELHCRKHSADWFVMPPLAETPDFCPFCGTTLSFTDDEDGGGDDE